MKRFIIFYSLGILTFILTAVLAGLCRIGKIESAIIISFPAIVYTVSLIVFCFIPWLVMKAMQKHWTVMSKRIKERNKKFMDDIYNR